MRVMKLMRFELRRLMGTIPSWNMLVDLKFYIKETRTKIINWLILIEQDMYQMPKPLIGIWIHMKIG